MTDRQREFLEGCCELTGGAAVGEGAFARGSALWVGQREVAHFDSERTLDVRLTKSVTGPLGAGDQEETNVAYTFA